jgi:hypothetical protein
MEYMAEPINDQISAVDNAVLTPFVRRILNREDAILLNWQHQPLTGGAEQASNLYRFSGTASIQGKEFPWSLILKIVQSPADGKGEPTSYSYWKREALAYQSGVLSQLPGGITAPRCFATEEKSNSAYWIWMEDVKDEIEGAWPLEQYGIVARCLGRFNGAYLAGTPLPDQPWVTRNWLRKYLDHAAPAVDRLIHSMEHPLIRRCLPGISAGFFQQIWDERLEVLDILEHLPQTFCHQDAFRRNLFYRKSPAGQPEVVAVDWSYNGIAPVGSEIGQLIHASMGFGAVPLADAYRLEKMALDGYMDGLSEAGWQGDPGMIRFGYTAFTYWRNAIGAFAGEMVPWMLDEQYHPFVEQVFGKPIEQVADDTGAIVEWVQYMYAQASRLKASVKEKG